MNRIGKVDPLVFVNRGGEIKDCFGNNPDDYYTVEGVISDIEIVDCHYEPADTGPAFILPIGYSFSKTHFYKWGQRKIGRMK